MELLFTLCRAGKKMAATQTPKFELQEVPADTFSFSKLDPGVKNVQRVRWLVLALVNSVARYPAEQRRERAINALLAVGRAFLGTKKRPSIDLESVALVADQWLEGRKTKYEFGIEAHGAAGKVAPGETEWHSDIAKQYLDELASHGASKRRLLLKTPSLYYVICDTGADGRRVVGMLGDAALKGLRPCLVVVRFSESVELGTIKANAWLLVHWLAATYIRADRERCRQEQLTRYLTRKLSVSSSRLPSPSAIIEVIRRAISEDLLLSLTPLGVGAVSVLGADPDRSCLWEIGTTAHPVRSRVVRGPTMKAIAYERFSTKLWNRPSLEEYVRARRSLDSLDESAMPDIEFSTPSGQGFSLEDGILGQVAVGEAGPFFVTLTTGDLPPLLQPGGSVDVSDRALPFVVRCEGWGVGAADWKDLIQESEEVPSVTVSRDQKLRCVTRRIENCIGEQVEFLFARWRESFLLEVLRTLCREGDSAKLCDVICSRLGAQLAGIVYHAPAEVEFLQPQILGQASLDENLLLEPGLLDELRIGELGVGVVFSSMSGRRLFLPPLVRNAIWCSCATGDGGLISVVVANVYSPFPAAGNEEYVSGAVLNYAVGAVEAIAEVIGSASSSIDASWWKDFLRVVLDGKIDDAEQVVRVVADLERRHDGNHSRMAASLGVKRTTLLQQLKRLSDIYPNIRA